MKKETIYLISAIAVGIIFVIIFIVLIKKRKIYKIQKQLQDLERQKNLIVSTPIMLELEKIKVIVKNDKLEEKYEEWKQRYKVLKETKFKIINDMLLDCDEFIDNKEMKEAKESILNVEMEIYKIRVTTDNLLDEIREVTMSEERNRAIVTKLKSKFRDLERTLNANPKSYGDIYKYIELQLENIEKRFTDFEGVMENNDYSEVVGIVKVLDEMIAHIAIVIEEVPDLILLTDKILPERIKEVKDNYEKLTLKNYPLGYLNVEHNVEQINKKIKEIVDRVKILNLEDSMFELKTFLDYFDNLLNDFEIEKRSKKVFDETAQSFKTKLLSLNDTVNSIYEQLDDIKKMYNLSTDDLTDLELVNAKVYDLNNEFNTLIGDLKKKKEPYSVLRNIIEKLSNDIQSTQDELDTSLQSLGSMHDDELRAREQLEELIQLQRKCKAKTHNLNLPLLSNDYFVELSEANEAIFEIIKELKKTPITIKTLNIRVDTARDLSLKLYNTTNELVKSAKLSEMIITYGNRYRPLNKDIENGLNYASQLFFKGNYKKSLETSINSIKIVEPDIYKKMLNIYKTEN